MKNEHIVYKYLIRFNNGKQKVFEFKLNKKTLNLEAEPESNLPDWVERKKFGCTEQGCKLASDDKCPIAIVVNRLMNNFRGIYSTEEVYIEFTSIERKSIKTTSIQTAVGSISGILMAASGCPILGKLKPLLRFHLPFASLEETEYRIFSMFILGQFLAVRKGLITKIDLAELKKLYESIQNINRVAAKKIQEVESADATINGLVILDMFALNVTFNLETDDFSELENLFKNWLT